MAGCELFSTFVDLPSSLGHVHLRRNWKASEPQSGSSRTKESRQDSTWIYCPSRRTTQVELFGHVLLGLIVSSLKSQVWRDFFSEVFFYRRIGAGRSKKSLVAMKLVRCVDLQLCSCLVFFFFFLHHGSYWHSMMVGFLWNAWMRR